MTKSLQDAIKDLDGKAENAILYHVSTNTVLRHSGESYIWAHPMSEACQHNPHTIICTRHEFNKAVESMNTKPVGWYGEFTWGIKAVWYKCVILPENEIVYKDGDNWFVLGLDNLDNTEFREFVPHKQRWVEQAQEIVEDVIDDWPNTEHMEIIYDALLSGELSVPDEDG